MRPTFMGFETAKTSIFANQKSIDIVGNNLANLDTNGYTRQRVDRVSMVVASSAGRVSQNRVGLMGQGVEALGVSQLRDSYLDQRFREEYANTAYHNEATDILKDIQSVFDDGNDVSSMTGLTDAMEKIFDSIQDFAQDPTSSTTANIVMSAFVNMTQVLNQLDSKLQNVLEQQSSDMKVTTDRVNQLLQQVAQLNKTISDQDMSLLTGTESYQPNELLDERNLILDELAGYGDIQVTQKADGSVDVVMGGVSVVTGDSFNTLNYVQHDDGTVALTWRNGGENAQFTSGALKADLEFINGRGTNVQSSNETPQKGIRTTAIKSIHTPMQWLMWSTTLFLSGMPNSEIARKRVTATSFTKRFWLRNRITAKPATPFPSQPATSLSVMSGVQAATTLW